MVWRAVALPAFDLELALYRKGMLTIARGRETVGQVGAHIGAVAGQGHGPAQLAELARGVAALTIALSQAPVCHPELGVGLQGLVEFRDRFVKPPVIPVPDA